MPTTCQICGRAIKATTGRIAHHGYRRPGLGWQTASCFGAKYRPYEEACDALPPAIASLQKHLAHMEKALRDHHRNPPLTLTHQKHDAYGRPRTAAVVLERPTDFDYKEGHVCVRPGTYAAEYRYMERAWEQEVGGSKSTLEFLHKRLADWRAPQ